MGAQLVAAVLANWTHVSDVEFRILVRMALTALDHPKGDRPAALYFGGHEALALALRRPFPTGDDEASEKARQNILRDVRRAVTSLIKQGAIESVGGGRAGRRAEYRLLLMPGKSGGVHDPS
ncbi:hypothetical protein [Nonomuraea sp. NPDC023979]|uniref:hypothetical protein n=1 Tax=Nonomuraea sp. NPDC023979 TaxID=3154796 RepID=UPI0033EBF796